MLAILVVVFPLLLPSAVMALSLAAAFKSVRLSTTRPLPLNIGITSLFLVLISYPWWLITQPAPSLGGYWNHTMSTLHSTDVTTAIIVYSYDLAHLCWITLRFVSQDSHFSLGPNQSCCGGQNLGLRHHDVSRHSHCFLFLYICHLPIFASPICCQSSPGFRCMPHSVCHRGEEFSVSSGYDTWMDYY